MSPRVEQFQRNDGKSRIFALVASLVMSVTQAAAGQTASLSAQTAAPSEIRATAGVSASQGVREDAPAAAELPTTPWGVFKSQLSAKGVDVAMSYVSDWSRVPSPGNPAQLIARGLMDSSVTFDLEKIAGIKGASAFVQHQWKRGGDGSAALGIYQSFSNIDADDFQRMYEAYYEQKFDDDRIRIKAGRVDANTEFAAVDAAGDFINASMGFSPTLFMLPTYPYPAPAVNVFAEPNSHLRLGVGAYGSQTGAARWRQPFLIAQATGSWNAAGGLDGYLRVGAWKQDLDIEDGVTLAASGRYVVVEQALWQTASGREGSGQLRAFGQFGFTNSRTDGADRHAGGGLIWNGLSRRRPDDALGVGATYVRMGLASDFTGSSELSVGPFMRLRVAPWLTVTPDLQYVRHPGGDPSAASATVGTLRLSAEF